MGTVQKIVGKHGVSWRARVDVGRDLNGKRVRETETFRLKRDAEEWVARVETRAQRNPMAASYSRLTLNAYVTEHWLPFYRTQAAPSSYMKRESAFRLHVLPRLGTMRLQDITPRHIQDLYRELEQRLTPASVDGVASALRAAFNGAVSWEMTTRNPCDGARPPRIVRRDPAIWTPEQFQVFLTNETDPVFRALWVTVTVTGARIGEVLALTWDDLDREHNTISITKSLTKRADGTWTIGPTKTKRNRVVAVPALLWELLEKTPTASKSTVVCVRRIGHTTPAEEAPATPIFINKLGRPITEAIAYNAWKNAIARAGLPPINIHDLRHMHATSGLRLGIPLKVMSDRLGHANIGITADTYTHVQRDLQHDAADRIAAYLLGHEHPPEE